MPGKPNVLLVLLDDLGIGQFGPVARRLQLGDLDPGLLDYTDALHEDAYDKELALASARRAMPFLTDLSSRSMVFSRAFATSSLCAPSRQGLLTGCNQTRWGAYRNIDVNVCGLGGRHCLVKDFQNNGYRTGLFGKWHVGSRDHALRDRLLDAGGTEEDVHDSGYWGSVIERDHPLNHGFDYAFFYNRWECDFYDSRLIWENRSYTGRQSRYNTDLFTDKALEFMEASLDSGQPFFTELALHAVHIPLNVDAPEKYRSQFQTGFAAIDHFYSHVYGVDWSIERISNFLKDRGEWDNTLFIFASDNGATCKVGGGDLSLIPGNGPHRGHKGQYYLGGIRVPLMVHWPERINRGDHYDEAVSLMDVLPTALEGAGVELPEGLDGRSLWSVIEGKSQTAHDHLFFTGIHAPSWGYSGKRVIGGAQERRDEFPGAWVMIEGDWLLRYVGRLDPGLMEDFPHGCEPFYSLHNLKEDPLEQVNLCADHPAVVERMKTAYLDHARHLPAPHTWDRKRWEELVSPDNPNR